MAALAKGVDSEARQAANLIREVDLALIGELLDQTVWVRMCSRAAPVSSSVTGSAPSIGRSAPWTRAIGGEATLTCRSEPSCSTT